MSQQPLDRFLGSIYASTPLACIVQNLISNSAAPFWAPDTSCIRNGHRGDFAEPFVAGIHKRDDVGSGRTACSRSGVAAMKMGTEMHI